MSLTLETPTRTDDTIVFDPITAVDVAAGRQWAVHALTDAPAALADDTATVVGELLDNAVLHGGPVVTLTVRRTADGVRVQVADTGEHTGPADGRGEGEHGLGLLIVQALSSQVEINRGGDGWSVTATVRTPNDARDYPEGA